MYETSSKTLVRVALCESQPLTAAGVQALLNAHTEFDVVLTLDSLDTLISRTAGAPPPLVLLDKSVRLDRLGEWIQSAGPRTATVVWGPSLGEAEALRLLKTGVRGILRKTAHPDTLLACLRAVAAGQVWVEDSVFRAGGDGDRYPRSELTPREQQVMDLVEHGLKNRDIAVELGIRPGTVKIHLKHIFEKTGVRGRYGLALNGLRHRVIEIPRAQEAALRSLLNKLPG
jgi:DNA-binding NarL/FixJ family response regulator